MLDAQVTEALARPLTTVAVADNPIDAVLAQHPDEVRHHCGRRKWWTPLEQRIEHCARPLCVRDAQRHRVDCTTARIHECHVPHPGAWRQSTTSLHYRISHGLSTDETFHVTPKLTAILCGCRVWIVAVCRVNQRLVEAWVHIARTRLPHEHRIVIMTIVRVVLFPQHACASIR